MATIAQKYERVASELIRDVCVPAGCEQAIKPATLGKLYACWTLSPKQVIRNIMRYSCTDAILDGQQARVIMVLSQIEEKNISA